MRLGKNPQVLSLDPELLGDVLEDIRRVGRATDTEEAAESLTERLKARIDAVTEKAAQTTNRPTVLQLEHFWLVRCFGRPLGNSIDADLQLAG